MKSKYVIGTPHTFYNRIIFPIKKEYSIGKFKIYSKDYVVGGSTYKSAKSRAQKEVKRLNKRK